MRVEKRILNDALRGLGKVVCHVDAGGRNIKFELFCTRMKRE